MFKKIFNYIILFGLIYLVFMHNSETFAELTVSHNKKPRKKKKRRVRVEETNTDVNSLIDSVIEEELFSQPISEEEAMEGMMKNESNIVDNYYRKYGNRGELDTEDLQETNVEEYIDESINQSSVENDFMPRTTGENNYADTEESIASSKSSFKCANQMIPKFSHKRTKKSKKTNMKLYKPKSSRTRHLNKIDPSVPKTVQKAFEERIVDFKKTAKLNKNEKERIQGCFSNDNQTSKFSTFEPDSETPYDMDVNANDVNFENYSLL